MITKAPVIPGLVIVRGCMFSGKTGRVIESLSRAAIAGQKVYAFKPAIDGRYSETELASHNKLLHNAIPVSSAIELYMAVPAEAQVVGIDEIQFFNQGIVQVCRDLVREGRRVIGAGLNLDFRGEPFGSMAELLCYADEVISLTAVCDICGNDATRTQRLINNEPADFNDPIIVVGGKAGSERYEARCIKHHVVTHWVKA